MKTWIIAFWVALAFTANLAEMLSSHVESNTLRMGIAFVSLFLTTLILGALVNGLISTLVQKTGLSGTDRMLGMLFGLGRGALLIALLILVANFTSYPEEMWWQNSVLIPQFEPIATWLHDLIPENNLNNNKLTLITQRPS